MIDTIIVSGGNIQKDFALPYLKNLLESKDKRSDGEKNISGNDEKTDGKGRMSSGRRNIKISLVAADKGLEFLLDAGMIPDIVIGDFDSLSLEGKRYVEFCEDEGLKFFKDSSASENKEGKAGTYMNGTDVEACKIIRLKPEKDDSDTQSAVNYAVRNGARKIVILGATGTRLDHVMSNLGLLVLGKNLGVSITLVDAHNCISLVPSGTILKKEEQFGKYVSFFPLGGTVEKLTLEGFKYPLDEYYLTTADAGLTVSNEIKDASAKITYKSGDLLMIMSRD